MIFNYYSDCHKKGVAEVPVVFVYTKPRTKFLGDCHEFKNIPKKLIPSARVHYNNHLEACHRYGCVDVNGNHEVSEGRGVDFDIDLGVLSEHGWNIFYSPEKKRKWANRKAGRGFFGRSISRMIHLARGLRSMSEFSDSKRKEISNYISGMKRAGHDFHTLVIGHTHPDKLIVEVIDGIVVYNVKQGYTELDINIPARYLLEVI